jgi:solute carrier family 35 protein F1/2
MGPQLRTDDGAEYDCSVCRHEFECVSTDEDVSEHTTYSNFLKAFQRRRKKDGTAQSRSKWKALIFGQIIALVATSMNASSYVLEYGMHKVFPMFLLFVSYTTLALRHLKHKEHSPISTLGIVMENEPEAYRLPLTSLELRTPWYYYLCLSCLDIGPNYLALLAMNKTSFTSATILGSLTIPSTMLFCRLLMGREYRWMHFVGAVLCMIGGTLIVCTDRVSMSSSGGDIAHPHSYAGDILAILASLGYGVGDACAEFWSKHVDREEYLGMIGLFGAMFTLIASLAYERNAVLDVFDGDDESTLRTVGVIFWYISSLVAYYVCGSLFLTKSDATLLNLSLQTSNFWAILFSIVVFQERPDLYLYISIFMVISGVFVYEHHGDDTTKRIELASEGIPNESSRLNFHNQPDLLPRYTVDAS